MTEAWIIDACRTPRGIGKPGKGAPDRDSPRSAWVRLCSRLWPSAIISIPLMWQMSSGAAMFSVVKTAMIWDGCRHWMPAMT